MFYLKNWGKWSFFELQKTMYMHNKWQLFNVIHLETSEEMVRHR